MKRLVIIAALIAVPASAHDAPTGWRYGIECCSTFDCFQAPVDHVRETTDGYVVDPTGELIPYGDRRIKISQDEFFHRCSHGGEINAGRTICLYVPNRGF